MSAEALPSGTLSRDALHSLCLSDAIWAERYEGWRDLGRGGSAAVVRTFSRDAGAEIALKVFLGLSGDDRVRFQREVRNAQSLTSPFVVRTYSPFARGSLAWIEMELVDGPDLRHELLVRTERRHAFALGEVAAVASSVAQALAAAHAAGVVHRDVKPANVLLPIDGAPSAKLGDFGIARILGATRLTATGLIAATPEFAAPEVVAGDEAGPPADVYGLALCVYLMLSGNQPPFELPEGAAAPLWLRAHAEQAPRPIARLRPDTPERLAALVDRGLSKDPGQRPDVAEILGGLGAPRPHVPIATRPAVPQRRLSVLLGVGLAGVLLGGVVVALTAGREVPTVHQSAASVETPASTPGSSAARLASTASPLPLPAQVSPPAARPVSAAPPVSSPRPDRSPRSDAQAAPTRATSTPAPGPAFRVTTDGGLLALSNTAGRAMTIRRVVALAANGDRYTMQVDEVLRPGEEVLLALDAFTPRPGPGLTPREVEVLVRDDSGTTRTIVVGPGRLAGARP